MYRTKTSFAKKRKGVPTGYIHKWRYSAGRWKEKKIRKGLWLFRYRNSKSNLQYRGGSGIPRNTRIVWKINAIQRARKVSPKKYTLNMVGRKKLVGIHIPKRRKKYRRR